MLTRRWWVVVALVFTLVSAQSCGNDTGQANEQTDTASDTNTADTTSSADVADTTSSADVADTTSSADADSTETTWAPNAELVEEKCIDLCATVEGCGRLDQFGGAECEAECAANYNAIDLSWYANADCIVGLDSCDAFDACMGPHAALPECENLCGLIIGCGAAQPLDMFDDPAACNASCDGSIGQIPAEGRAPLLSCFEDALENNCDILSLPACLPDEALNCAETCSTLEFCESGDDIFATFADTTACEVFCDSLDTGGRLALELCLDTSDCGPSSCDDIGATPAAGCEAACDSALALCPGASGFDVSTCPWLCTGVDEGLAITDATIADACLMQMTECVPPHSSSAWSASPSAARPLVRRSPRVVKAR